MWVPGNGPDLDFIEAWRPAVTTSTDPLLEIRVAKVGGRTYSLLKPGIY